MSTPVPDLAPPARKPLAMLDPQTPEPQPRDRTMVVAVLAVLGVVLGLVMVGVGVAFAINWAWALVVEGVATVALCLAVIKALPNSNAPQQELPGFETERRT